ncbi:trigger factor family protein, partial [Patescibacteria group bacterium]|nr:trigger factor family protein [Patescibacteria group bacterium]
MGSVLQTFNNISYSKENLEDGRLKINIEIENERFQVVKQKVYDKLAKEVTIEGFRPGKAP